MQKHLTLTGESLSLSPPVAEYVRSLEQIISQAKDAQARHQGDISQERDRYLQTVDLLKRRPRDRRLAQVLCDWMNMHHKAGSTAPCRCELCQETKEQMNRLGDPILHTTDGWRCQRDEDKTRDVAGEFVDNTPKITQGTIDSEVWKP